MNGTIQRANYYRTRDKFWKQALIALLNTENSIIIHSQVDNLDMTEDIDSDISVSLIFMFLNAAGYDQDIMSYIESLDDYSSASDEVTGALFENLCMKQAFYLIKKFEVSKYLEKVSSTEGTYAIADKYLLTSKGIDVALKLQEHADNERRFKENYNISQTLQKNSKRSLIISSVALILTIAALTLAFIRLDRTDKILEQSERRLTIAEKNHADTLRKK
jgi:hypothetical protein